jgi:hypothetical protein
VLDEAGWEDSNGDGVREKRRRAVLKYGDHPRDPQGYLAVAQRPAEVGIRLDLLNYESDTFFGGYADGGCGGDWPLDIFSTHVSNQFLIPTHPNGCAATFRPMRRRTASIGRGCAMRTWMRCSAETGRPGRFAERQKTFSRSPR